MANILVLGGAGFIGKNLCLQFALTGDQVIAYDRSFAAINKNDYSHDNIMQVEGLLSDIETIASMVIQNSIDVVVHAVSTMIPSSPLQQYRYELEQVMLPSFELLELFAQHHVKFLYCSSGGAIYGRESVPPHNEMHPLNPINYYGESKKVFESHLALIHRTQGLEYIIVRPSNPFGIGQRLGGQQGFVAAVLDKILKQEPLTIWGDGSVERDYIYITDLCEAIQQIVTIWPTDNQILNIGSGVPLSLLAVISTIETVVQRRLCHVVFESARSVDVPRHYLDISTLQTVFPFKPMSFESGVQHFWNAVGV